jgi:hypothetical protein
MFTIETQPITGRRRWRCECCSRHGIWLDDESAVRRNGGIHVRHCGVPL